MLVTRLLLFSFLLYTILFSSVLVKGEDYVPEDDPIETTEVKALSVVSTFQKFSSSTPGTYSYTYSYTTGK
jgi:hypothetical protein